jgi:hypothetical protein
MSAACWWAEGIGIKMYKVFESAPFAGRIFCFSGMDGGGTKTFEKMRDF